MFERTLKIIDQNLLEKIKNTKILLVGVGGVGGFALEALIRMGFLNITIIDHDKIDLSNLNRQIITNQENIGEYKVDVAKKRALKINPNTKITTHKVFLNKENLNTVIDDFDYILDACDTITTKILLQKIAEKKKKKCISCMGTGNRLEPEKVKKTTLDKTYNDPLAKAMRKLAKQEGISLNFPVIWSEELPIKTKEEIGSIILVPAYAGLQMVSYLIEDLKK